VIAKTIQSAIIAILYSFITACNIQSSQGMYSSAQPKSPSPSVAPQEDNFAFQFSFGSCGTDTLDTFTSTYTKDLITSATVTTTVILSKEDLSRVFIEMQRINIFGYPSEYVITTDGATQVGMIEPATTYAFISTEQIKPSLCSLG
jgi:hypothetical protein